MHLLDDIEVIRSVQSGNTESFSLLVQKYHRQLLSFIYRLMGDAQIVEDIGQDVFLSVYKSIRAFDVRRGVPFSAWLFITARNRCISELRKKRPAVALEKTSGSIDRQKNPEQIARDEERFLALRAALEQIPEPFRGTMLQSLGGDSPEEIAVRNRISPGTVKSRLSRARERLRPLLRAHFGGKDYGQF
jgi:RNA polymerase sigma-70 factor, ECF subfamily